MIFRQTTENLRASRADLGVEQQLIPRPKHLPDTLQQLVFVLGKVLALIDQRILRAKPFQIRAAFAQMGLQLRSPLRTSSNIRNFASREEILNAARQQFLVIPIYEGPMWFSWGRKLAKLLSVRS